MRRLILLVSFYSLALHGKAQQNPLFDYIPDNTATVMHVDLMRLGLKFPLLSFKNSYIYRQLAGSGKTSVLSFFNNIKNSGIDISKGLMIVFDQSSGKGSGSGIPAISVFARLTDANVFTERVRELNQDNETIKQYGTDRIILSDHRLAIGWNNDVVVFTTKYDRSIQDEFFPHYSDTTTVVSMDTVTTTIQVVPDTVDVAMPSDNQPQFDYRKFMEKMKRSQRNIVFDLLARDRDNSISQDPEFISVMNEKADAKMWSTRNDNSVPVELMGVAPLLKNFQKISGEKGTATFNFEQGKIVMRGNNYPGPELSELYKLQAARKHDNSLIARAPVEGRFGLFSVSFDNDFAKGIKNYLKLDEFITSKNEEAKFDLSLLNGAVKSQAMLVLLKNLPDHPKDHSDGSMDVHHFGPVPLLAVEIADLKKFEALKQALIAADREKRKESHHDEMDLVIKNTDKVAVLTISEELANSFMAPADPNLPAWVMEFRDYPFLGNLDFVALFNAFTKQVANEKKNPANEILRRSLDQVYYYGGKYENGAVKSNFEFRFADKEKNSLHQLFDLVNNLVEEMERQEKLHSEGFGDEKVKIEEVTLTDIRQEEDEPPPPPPPPVKKPVKKKN